MPSDEQMLEDLTPLLERELRSEPFEWTAIGDNWAASWSWAKKLERDYGIDHQRALRYVVERIRPKEE